MNWYCDSDHCKKTCMSGLPWIGAEIVPVIMAIVRRLIWADEWTTMNWCWDSEHCKNPHMSGLHTRNATAAGIFSYKMVVFHSVYTSTVSSKLQERFKCSGWQTLKAHIAMFRKWDSENELPAWGIMFCSSCWIHEGSWLQVSIFE